MNNCIAYSFSLLSSVFCSMTNVFLSIVSNADRHIWYCSGKCSVVYSLMDSLARLRRYCTSSTTQVLAICSSRAISEWFMPRDFNWITFSRRHCNCSALLFKLSDFYLMNITSVGFLALSPSNQGSTSK